MNKQELNEFFLSSLENGNICESGCAGIKADKVIFSNVSEIGEKGFANSSIGEIDLSSI